MSGGGTKIKQEQTKVPILNPLLFENAFVEDNGGNVFVIDNQEVPTHNYLEYGENYTSIQVNLNQDDDFVLCSLCILNSTKFNINIDFVSDTATGNNNNPLYTVKKLPSNGRMCIMYMKINKGIFVWEGVVN